MLLHSTLRILFQPFKLYSLRVYLAPSLNIPNLISTIQVVFLESLPCSLIPQSSGRYCIHFYLFDYGREMGQFSVNIEGPRLVPQVVKRWSGSQKKAWINVGITLTTPAEWKLVLESHVGSGTHSDIALDDLQVYSGSCVFYSQHFLYFLFHLLRNI